jgi:hypothetical protein
MTTQQNVDARAAFPAAELEKYRGMWVAFAADGSKVVASGRTEIEAAANAEATGLGPAEYVLEPIPQEDTLLL